MKLLSHALYLLLRVHNSPGEIMAHAAIMIRIHECMCVCLLQGCYVVSAGVSSIIRSFESAMQNVILSHISKVHQKITHL